MAGVWWVADFFVVMIRISDFLGGVGWFLAIGGLANFGALIRHLLVVIVANFFKLFADDLEWIHHAEGCITEDGVCDFPSVSWGDLAEPSRSNRKPIKNSGKQP